MAIATLYFEFDDFPTGEYVDKKARKLQVLLSGGRRVANHTLGKNVSVCLFESCRHQEISKVFRFVPVSHHSLFWQTMT
jgi:hypothetical protein